MQLSIRSRPLARPRDRVRGACILVVLLAVLGVLAVPPPGARAAVVPRSLVDPIGPAFPPCSPYGYLTQNNGSMGQPVLDQIDLVTGDIVEFTMPVNVNAAGYNELDNYIYASDPSAGTAVRVHADGTLEDLGKPSGFPDGQPFDFQEGDITSDGFWFLKAGPDIWIVDMRPSSPNYFSVDNHITVNPPAGMAANRDFVLINGLLFQVWAETDTGVGPNHLMMLNGNTWDDRGVLMLNGAPWIDSNNGAAYADAGNGYIYTSNNQTGVISRIAMFTNIVEVFAPDGPPSTANDGARCANAPVPVDFGDGPDGYSTSLAANGPRHSVTPGLALGAIYDIDADAQPGPNADGDDVTGTDDEDAFTGLTLTPSAPSVTVPITNTAGAVVTVAGWVDFDANGAYDPSEQAMAATNGTSVTLSWPAVTVGVPATQSRFRLYSGSVLNPSPVGPAAGGEVEDHVATFTSDYTVTKTASVNHLDTVVSGQTIDYTITVTNTGSSPANASFTDDLADVLDDANLTAGPDAGTINGTVLSWSGTVPAGQQATVHYSVQVKPADQFGNSYLSNVVVGGSNCPAGAPIAPPCGLQNPAAGYLVSKTAIVNHLDGVTSGQSITYTISLSQRGGFAPMIGATVTDDISDVLDDAVLTAGPDGGAALNGTVISWTGDLAIGATQEIHYTVQVDPSTGFNNAFLSNVAVGGSNCPAGMPAAPPCGLQNPTGGYTIEKFSDVAPGTAVRPGDTITYTVRVAQAGLAPVTGATFTDDLADVLDDATLTAGPSAGSINGTVLSWTGDLAVGQVVDVTYSVQVKPGNQFGNAILSNVAIGGSNCPPDAPPVPPCGKQELAAGFTVEKVHSVPAGQSVQPGDSVTYTITVRQTGAAAYPGATFTDDLADALDDATLTAGPNAGSINGTVLSWTGDLAIGQVVQITYTVQIKPAEQFGNGALDNAVVGGQCPPVNPPPECNPFTIPLRGYLVGKTSDPPSLSTVSPGQDVAYTISIRQVGTAPFLGAALSDELVDVFDDAVLTVAPVASTGTVNLTGDDLTWSGDLAVGAVATITYAVRVDSVAGLANGLLLNVVTGPGCPPGTLDGRCRPYLPVGAYRVAKTSDVPDGAVVRPGDTVTYTITVTQLGVGAVANAMVTDDLTDVLDDAVVTGEPTNGAARTGNVVSWNGPLAVGQVVTFSYTVTVDAPQNLGSGSLVNAVAGPNCPPDAVGPPCRLTDPVGGHLIAKTSNPPNGSTVVPGQLVAYTITVTQVGAGAANALTVNDDLTGILDDAALQGQPTASSGTVGITGSTLTWNGDLAVGASATITYQVRVNPAASFGDAILPNGATSPRSNCVTPQPGCITTVRAGAYTIDKTSNVPAGTPVDAGSQVTYTLTLTHLGAGPLTGKTVTDDLSDVLDDASLVGNPTASSGSVDVTGDTLTWTGDLANDQVVTVTYIVQVNPPQELGNGELLNVVMSPDEESDCPDPPITDPADPQYNPDCLVREDTTGSTVVKTSDPADGTVVAPRDVVTYTLTITNTGSVALPGHQVHDDLSDVLDDSTILDAPAADAGAVTLVGNDLTWTGDLAPDQVAVVTYSVTVDEPDAFGNAHVGNVVTAEGPSNCPEPPITDPTDPLYDPDCHVDHDSGGWTQLKTSDPVDGSEVEPGDAITYTLTFTNTGATDLTGLEAIDDLSNVLDDAVIDEEPTTDLGDVVRDDMTLTWTGDLAEGEVAIVTYSVIVNEPEAYTNGHLGNVVTANGPADCVPPAILDPSDPLYDPDCDVNQSAEGYTVVKSSEPADGATVTPGTVVTYTLTLTNTGDVALTGETVTDDLSGVLDDATLVAGPTADGGTVAVAAPTLTWTGDLGIDQVVTITYAVQVNSADQLGDGVIGNVVAGSGQSSCPDPAITDPAAPGFDPLCLTEHSVGAYTTVKSLVSPASPKPGDVVTYQIVVTSTGTAAVTGAFFDDDLTGVLDDGIYNNDGSVAGPGTVAYTAPVLRWTGDLGVGEVATVTYSAILNPSITGDAIVRNVVTSGYCVVAGPAATSQSAQALADMPPGCVVETPIPGIRVTKAASNQATAQVGDVVTYTVTATNVGQAPLTGATFTDNLGDVIDDATYRNDHAVDVGTITYNQPVLAWTGDLLPGQVATLTYSMTVNATGGNGVLGNTVLSDSPASNCVPGNLQTVCLTNSTISRTVVPPPATPDLVPPTPEELPRTGGSVMGIVRAALLLLLVGAAVTLLAARRRRAHR